MAKAKKSKTKAKAKTKAKSKPKAKSRPKTKASVKAKSSARAKAMVKAKPKARPKAQAKKAPGYPVINQSMCQDIDDAYMTQGVNFNTIPGGTCTLSKGNSNWPFTAGPPISLPGLTNPQVTIASGLNTSPPNNVYEYVCSCCPPHIGVHTVTVVG